MKILSVFYKSERMTWSHPFTKLPRRTFLFLLCLTFFFSCEKILPPEPAENELLEGPIEGLSGTQLQLFLAGDEDFGEVFTPESGLGPYFVENACASCHVGDGKGHPSTNLTRFGRSTNDGFDHLLSLGGPQLQNRAIPGFIPEAIPEEATGVSVFTAPAVTGLGYLEAVSDETLMALADPNDENGDGISGRLNYVEAPDYYAPAETKIPDGQGRFIGRFGKKAAAIDLLHQTVNAYKQDIGITSDFDMEDPLNNQVAGQVLDPIADPELPSANVNSVVFYLKTLKAPIPRDQDDPTVIIGKQLFETINCSSCHLPNLQTGISDLEVLSEKEFHPYTDLLLHDMGDGLDDGYTEGIATTSEWRTPPLWGLGLSPDAQGGEYFLMHDGRAKSIEEAILLHGGEAENSKAAFEKLAPEEKAALIKFLESL